MTRIIGSLIALSMLILMTAAYGNVCHEGDTDCICASQDDCSWSCSGGKCTEGSITADCKVN